MTDLVMFDSIDLAQIPPDAAIIGAYVNGRWATALEVPRRFPRARMVTIAVSAGADAEVLDVEPGDAGPADVPLWHSRQQGRGIARPCLYASASTMETGIIPLIRSGAIVRAAVRLWSAHYTHTPHICGPATCKAMSISADGTQWTDKAMGRNLDQSLLTPGFFAAPVPPARPATVQSGPRQWTTAGQSSLAELAAGQKTQPSTILRLTAEHSPGAIYPAPVGDWLNGVFAGTVDPAKPMPKGLALYLPG